MAKVSFSNSKLCDWGPLTAKSMVPGKLYTVERKHRSTGSPQDTVLATVPFRGQGVSGFAHVIVAVRLDDGSFFVADESPDYRVTEIAEVTLTSGD